MRNLRAEFMSQLVNLIINNVPFCVLKSSHPLQLQINLQKKSKISPSFYCFFLASRFEYKSQSRLLFYRTFSLVKNLCRSEEKVEDLRTTKHKSVIWEGKFPRREVSRFFINIISDRLQYHHYHPSTRAICSGKHHKMLRE